MSHPLIFSCLQLSSDHWPPDHYTLLGLEPGEVEAGRIEQCVQERMEKLRRYQLTHAEHVTEAMNRLAQAFVCLTDPVAKKAYDAKLSPQPAKRPAKPAGLRRASRMDPDSRPAPPTRARASSRWLLLAWIVWLLLGVAGTVAGIVYFPEIQASFSGKQQQMRPAKKAPPKPSLSSFSERPTRSYWE